MTSYQQMIQSILKNNKGQLDIEKIKKLINDCIITLDSAQQYMREYKKEGAIKSSALRQMYNTQLEKYGKEKLMNAISEDKKNINEEMLKKKTMEALKKGYALISELSALIMDRPIEYSIITAGRVSGEHVLSQSTLTLDQLLDDSSLEFSKAGGIGLKVVAAKKDIESALKSLKTETKMDQRLNNRNIFANAKLMQLNTNQKNMWSDLVEIGENASTKVQNDKGNWVRTTKYGLNFGVITESFMGSYRNKMTSAGGYNLIHSFYYKLLEKGRNNLAYYKGPDISYIDDFGNRKNEQIKSLTSYTSKGRFDIATLSNVLAPLKDLESIFSDSTLIQENLNERLAQEFTAKPREGDRPWNEAVSAEVHAFLDETFGMNHFT